MSVIGLNASTARAIEDLEHLRQSVRDVLTTPRGSRVMRRDYGSDLPELVDQTLTDLTIARIYAATVDALTRWEPRIRVTRVQAEPDQLAVGRLTITLEAIYVPSGTQLTLAGITL